MIYYYGLQTKFWEIIRKKGCFAINYRRRERFTNYKRVFLFTMTSFIVCLKRIYMNAVEFLCCKTVAVKEMLLFTLLEQKKKKKQFVLRCFWDFGIHSRLFIYSKESFKICFLIWQSIAVVFYFPLSLSLSLSQSITLGNCNNFLSFPCCLFQIH